MTCCCYLFHLLHQTFHLLVRRSSIKFHIDWFRIVNCVFYSNKCISGMRPPAALTFLSVALSLQKVGHPWYKVLALPCVSYTYLLTVWIQLQVITALWRVARFFTFIQPYSGEGDVVQWFDKLALACKRLREESVEVLPLLKGRRISVKCQEKRRWKNNHEGTWRRLESTVLLHMTNLSVVNGGLVSL